MQRRGTKIGDRTVDDNETMITRSEGQSSWPTCLSTFSHYAMRTLVPLGMKWACRKNDGMSHTCENKAPLEHRFALVVGKTSFVL